MARSTCIVRAVTLGGLGGRAGFAFAGRTAIITSFSHGLVEARSIRSAFQPGISFSIP